MILVPELQKVFILVPRTGSGSLYREILRVYPKSMLLYRHMEADGCPRGYDHWERIGFVRHPLARLWSLYRFMQDFGGGACVQGGAASSDAERIRAQVTRTFEDWVLNNESPFTTPYSLNGDGAYWPVLSRINPVPETKISQRAYLRPDLGTTVFKFENLQKHMAGWGLNPSTIKNAAGVRVRPAMSQALADHFAKFCEWDLAQTCKEV